MRIIINSGFPMERLDEVRQMFIDAGLGEYLHHRLAHLVGFPTVPIEDVTLEDYAKFNEHIGWTKDVYREGDFVYVDIEGDETKRKGNLLATKHHGEMIQALSKEFPKAQIGCFGPFRNDSWPPYVTLETMLNAYSINAKGEPDFYGVPLYCPFPTSQLPERDFRNRLTSAISLARRSVSSEVLAFYKPTFVTTEHDGKPLDELTTREWWETIGALDVDRVIFWIEWDTYRPIPGQLNADGTQRMRRVKGGNIPNVRRWVLEQGPWIKESLEMVAPMSGAEHGPG